MGNCRCRWVARRGSARTEKRWLEMIYVNSFASERATDRQREFQSRSAATNDEIFLNCTDFLYSRSQRPGPSVCSHKFAWAGLKAFVAIGLQIRHKGVSWIKRAANGNCQMSVAFLFPGHLLHVKKGDYLENNLSSRNSVCMTRNQVCQEGSLRSQLRIKSDCLFRPILYHINSSIQSTTNWSQFRDWLGARAFHEWNGPSRPKWRLFIQTDFKAQSISQVSFDDTIVSIPLLLVQPVRQSVCSSVRLFVCVVLVFRIRQAKFVRNVKGHFILTISGRFLVFDAN